MTKKLLFKHCTATAFVLLSCLFVHKEYSYAQAIGSVANTTSSGEIPSSDIIVLFHEHTNTDIQTALLRSTGATVLWHENDAALLHTAADSAELLASLSANPLISVADYDASVALSALSDDPYSATQWGLDNPGRYSYIAEINTSTILSTPDVDMNIPECWTAYTELLTQPREVIVAVIDTGVDINHPDLAHNIWINESEIPGDGIDNDNNGYIDDINGWDFFNGDNTLCHYAEDNIHHSPEDNDNHGTHVAGIIAAVRDNGIGITGVAGNGVKIMPLKIHGADNGTGTISDAVRAIRYATAMGADICNISWGTTKSNNALKQAIKESDMLFVAAAGNSGNNTDTTPIYPACYKLDNIISVTFIDANGLLSVKSNYGEKSVDLAAPGVHIYSTCVGDYCSYSGSSMAAPHVVGVAALLYSFDSNLYPANIKEILLNTVRPLEGLQGKMQYPGIPDAYAAIQAATELQKDYYAPTISFQSGFKNEYIHLTITGKDRGGSGIRTIRYASGTRDIGYFKHGTAGTSLTAETLSLSKSGSYTFYISDYAGNERIVIYRTTDDITAPTAKLSYQVAYNYKTSTIQLSAEDKESGIKTVKYAPGEQTVDYFLSGQNGTEVTLTSGAAKITVEDTGIYTVYLCDYRGNKSIHTIHVEIVKSTALSLNASKKTLTEGKTWQLKPTMKPVTTTDRVRYRSSDTAVCKVSSSGKVTAVAPGTATITVTASSGLKRSCQITVTAAAN